jgi:hypothetical protein
MFLEIGSDFGLIEVNIHHRHLKFEREFPQPSRSLKTNIAQVFTGDEQE